MSQAELTPAQAQLSAIAAAWRAKSDAKLRLLAEWEPACSAEYKRFDASLPSRRISIWNPAITFRWAKERSEKVQTHMAEWSAAWWLARGYKMTITDFAEGTMTIEEIPGAPQ